MILRKYVTRYKFQFVPLLRLELRSTVCEELALLDMTRITVAVHQKFEIGSQMSFGEFYVVTGCLLHSTVVSLIAYWITENC
jgi:hypothetical protein